MTQAQGNSNRIALIQTAVQIQPRTKRLKFLDFGFFDLRAVSSESRTVLAGVGIVLGSACLVSQAQTTYPQPVTDSSAQASPISKSARGPIVDSSNEASPLPGRSAAAPVAALAPGTAIAVSLGQGIDSGRLKNGQTVQAKLTAPVHTRSGSTLPVGAPVSLTVIQTVPAGKLSAVGEFSLQVLRVDHAPAFTDTQTFRGKPGHRDLPDSAAALGTDAGLPAGAPLTFHVQPDPIAATAPPAPGGQAPGSVNGVANGQAPPTNAANQPQAGGQGAGQGKAGQVRPVQPANNTFGPAQNAGQPSVAPNQPSEPSQSPATTGPTRPQ